MAFIQFFDATETDKQQLTEFLRPSDHYWEFVDGPISEDNIKPEAEVISVFVSSTVTESMLERLPRLKLIACRSTGFNNIPVSAAEAHDITVVNVPSYGSQTVAEYTIALLLALTRKLRPTLASVASGDVEPEPLRGIDLFGKTLGLVGAGRIGQAVARIGWAMGMRVVAYDPYPNETATRTRGLELVSFETLLSVADVVSLHSPATRDNYHLMNESTLSAMKPGAILINTARGELVETKALISVLESGHLAAAALDVFEGEKLVDLHEELVLLRDSQVSGEVLRQNMELSILKNMPNVIITPHNAFNTTEAIARINLATVDNIMRYWFGEVPNRVVAPVAAMGKLIIARHGESEWNALGKWTGTTDVHLTEKGFHDAALMGQILRDVHIDYAFASQQIRTLETLESICNASQQFDVPFERSAALNERDYGDYTGKNKWEIKDQLGEDTFNHLRRDWDYPVPNGETLKQVYDRVLPFYLNRILPRLQKGENVLLVSHGNAIRSLIKYLEKISDQNIADVEMIFGSILLYDVDNQGYAQAKAIRQIPAA